MKHKLLLLFLGICVCSMAADEKNKTVVVTGEYTLLTTQVISFPQAQELARQDAKNKAVEKVCTQKISVWDKLEISSAGETFNSLSESQFDGEVVDFNVISEEYKFSETNKNELIFTCKAKVTVKKGLDADPNFFAKIDFPASTFKDGESIRFIIRPTQDCYLKIFLFVDLNTGYQIYPNVLDNSIMIAKNKKLKFPISDIYDFVATKDTKDPIETNYLVFVFTKQERAFDHEQTSRAEIEKWIARIPSDEKYYEYKIINILPR